jgi:hypothetical protein
MATFNLFLAGFWLAAGFVLLVMPQLLEGFPRVGGLLANRELLGGVAVVLAVYNVARWNSLRAFHRDQEAIQQAAATRERLDVEHEREPVEPPNPAFNFEEPPGTSPRNPTDRPPSAN